MDNMGKQSIIVKIRSMFLIALLAILVVTLVFYFFSYKSAKNERQSHIETVVDNLAQNTTNITSSVALMAETISNTRYSRILLTDDSNFRVRSECQQALNKLVVRMVKSSTHVQTIVLLDDEGKVYSFNMFDFALAGRLNNAYDIFENALKLDESFTGVLSLPNEEGSYYVYSQPVYENYASKSLRIGTCVVICSTNTLEEACKKANASEHATISILDQSQQVLASNNIASGEKSVTYLIPVDDANWSVYCAVPHVDYYGEVLLITYLAVLLLVVLISVFLLLVVQIKRNVVSPLGNVVDFLRKPPNLILLQRLDTNIEGEIGVLSDNINQMLDQISNLNKTVLQNQVQLYEVELLKNKAQLQALKSQINPHFLYNSLNSIQGLACQEKYREICVAVAALSYVLRYSLHDGHFATVEEEAQCIEQYLQIMNIRFDNRFKLSMVVDEELREHEIPRFLLQPVVENAIIHGLKDCASGVISIEITCKDSLIHIECSDDGLGIVPERLEKLQDLLEKGGSEEMRKMGYNNGIGLANVQSRLRILYGETYGLTLSSEVGTGTTVRAVFPKDQVNVVHMDSVGQKK